VDLYLHSANTPSWRGAQFKKSTPTTLSLPLRLTFSATEVELNAKVRMNTRYVRTCKEANVANPVIHPTNKENEIKNKPK
jgi:hypothetical protein